MRRTPFFLRSYEAVMLGSDTFIGCPARDALECDILEVSKRTQSSVVAVFEQDHCTTVVRAYTHHHVIPRIVQ